MIHDHTSLDSLVPYYSKAAVFLDTRGRDLDMEQVSSKGPDPRHSPRSPVLLSVDGAPVM